MTRLTWPEGGKRRQNKTKKLVSETNPLHHPWASEFIFFFFIIHGVFNRVDLFGKATSDHFFLPWLRLRPPASKKGEPNQQLTLNKLPTELRYGSFVNKRRLEHTNRRQTCRNVCATCTYSDWASTLHATVGGWEGGEEDTVCGRWWVALHISDFHERTGDSVLINKAPLLLKWFSWTFFSGGGGGWSIWLWWPHTCITLVFPCSIILWGENVCSSSSSSSSSCSSSRNAFLHIWTLAHTHTRTHTMPARSLVAETTRQRTQDTGCLETLQ